MVHGEKRKIGSVLIQRLVAGEITNEDFQDQFPRDAADPALGAIYERLWVCYGDLTTHRLTGRHAVSDEARELFLRCRAFLDSDLEYEWPPVKRAPLVLIVLRIFGLRKAVARREQHEMDRLRSFGDFDVWPFRRTFRRD